MSRRGAVDISSKPHDIDAGFPAIALAAAPIDPANPFLYHKTTNRGLYEDAIAARPGFDDVLLYNDRGEVTESTIANLVVESGGVLLTPPVSCGLLPGTLRAHLLEEGRIREKVITLQDVIAPHACYLLNSVRGFHPVSIAYKSVISCSVLVKAAWAKIAISGPKSRSRPGTDSAVPRLVDVSAAKSMAPSEDLLFRDGLGDRLLIRDAHGRPAHECLLIRPELSSVPAFEFALNERLWLVEKFDHPAIPDRPQHRPRTRPAHVDQPRPRSDWRHAAL